MDTTKTLGEWGAELNRLNKAISWLDEIYNKTDEVTEKQIILTALKCVEKRHELIADVLIAIEVPDIL